MREKIEEILRKGEQVCWQSYQIDEAYKEWFRAEISNLKPLSDAEIWDIELESHDVAKDIAQAQLTKSQEDLRKVME